MASVGCATPPNIKADCAPWRIDRVVTTYRNTMQSSFYF